MMDAATVKRELVDPFTVCGLLGLLDGQRGRDWQRYGRNAMIRCPSPDHADRNPSCEVFIGKRDGLLHWCCYTCDASGDVLDLVKHTRGTTTFTDTAREAAALLGVTFTPRDPSDATSAPLPEPLEVDAFAALAETFITSGLTDLQRRDAADVREYLTARGILDLALRDGWCALPAEQDRHALAAHVIREHGEQAWKRARLHGLRWKYPHLRFAVPWRDARGRITGLQCRGIDGTEPRYILRGDRVAPYGAHRTTADGAPVAFVEGSVDALALECLMRDWRRGEQRDVHVLGLPAAGTWSVEWAEHARGRAAWIALDLDTKETAREAVKRARERMRRDLEGIARTVKVYAPRLEGRASEKTDWSDVWEATRW